jgi:rhamnogalacturonan endolyase
MAVWFDGNLSRQLIEDNIIQSPKYGRTFTMYRYSETFINGTKSNPSWYGDIFGDWREEIILPDATRLADIKIFSTWYPTSHKFPWLMTDHCYWMSCLNENIGYNQPTNTGYYIGSDLKSDAVAWAEAEKVQNRGITTGIRCLTPISISNGEEKIYSYRVEITEKNEVEKVEDITAGMKEKAK